MKLYCEYLVNPIGVDTPAPRFSWVGNKQKAYQIVVATSKKNLDCGIYDMWDSGKIQSTACTNIPYSGIAFTSEKLYWWKVFVEGESGLLSEAAYFQTGILDKKLWQAAWLGSSFYKNDSSLLLRREIYLSKSLEKAYAYISSTGIYEAAINGIKVGNAFLEPPVSNKNKTAYYRMYDVNDYFQNGKNVFGLMLGRGWSDYPAGFVQLHLLYQDGSSEWIYTKPDGNWRVRPGFITSASIYNGEYCNAGTTLNDWCRPEFIMDRYWEKPLLYEPPGSNLRCSIIEPIQRMKEIETVKYTKLNDTSMVYDFGQNFAGWVRLVYERESGIPITLKYAEMLDLDGTVNQSNLRSAKCTDTFVPDSSKKEQTYEPRFTYHGFRFVQVEGDVKNFGKNSLTGVQIRNAVWQSGNFSSSNSLLNNLQQCILRTEESNLHDIPTDCPQRDERRAWLNDMTVRAETALYNFRLPALYTKWIQDIRNDQGSCGGITDTAPFMNFGRRPADPVSSSYLLVPWLLYLFYADTGILRRFYDGFKEWQEYLSKQAENHILRYSYYGDWAPPISQGISGSIGSGAVSNATPGALISTGYYYHNACLLKKIADVLDERCDSQKYAEQSHKIYEAFNRSFYNEEHMGYGTSNQAANAFALYMGLVPKQHKAAVVSSLVKAIEDSDRHFTTGNLCTRYLLEVLSENGHIDTAYKMMTQTSYPSFGYMLENGATTIWERWENVVDGSLCSMASQNHPMFASVGIWFYKYLAGIRLDEKKPGFENTIIKPILPAELKEVNAAIDTPRGKLSVKISRHNDGIEFCITVPENGTADIYLPNNPGTSVQIDNMSIESAMEAGTFEEIGQEGGNIVFISARGHHVFLLL